MPLYKPIGTPPALKRLPLCTLHTPLFTPQCPPFTPFWSLLTPKPYPSTHYMHPSTHILYLFTPQTLPICALHEPLCIHMCPSTRYTNLSSSKQFPLPLYTLHAPFTPLLCGALLHLIGAPLLSIGTPMHSYLHPSTHPHFAPSSSYLRALHPNCDPLHTIFTPLYAEFRLLPL